MQRVTNLVVRALARVVVLDGVASRLSGKIHEYAHRKSLLRGTYAVLGLAHVLDGAGGVRDVLLGTTDGTVLDLVTLLNGGE